MPFLNAQGHIAHGVGGSGAFLDNTLFAPGGSACWVDAYRIAFQWYAPDGVYIGLHDIRTKQTYRAVSNPAAPGYNRGANTLAAGGGVWAAWASGYGVYSSTGWYKPDAGLLTVGDAGQIVYLDVYAQGGPIRVREANGYDYLLSDGSALVADAHASGAILWTDYANAVHTYGMPLPLVIGNACYSPRAALINGEWWLSYFSALAGVGCVVHPFNSTVGYKVVPGGDCWQDISSREGQPTILGTAWSVTQGEGAGTVFARDINILTEPRIELQPIDPPDPPDPPINPEPPEAEMNRPEVTVENWTLDQVDDGKEFVFRDSANPREDYRIRVWVQHGSMHAEITNSRGSAQTGATRAVTPCPAVIEPPPIEPPIEPPVEAPTKFTLKRHDGGYLCVGADGFLTQHGSPAVCELVLQDDGYYGLKANGKYCAAESDDRVKADRDAVGDWEQWVPVPCSNTSLALQAWNARYLSCHDDGTIRTDQPEIGGWETLVLTPWTGLALHGRLRIDGRMLRDDVDFYRPVWVDALDILTLDYGSYLDWAVATGFNGVRVFGGNTGRGNNQTPESAAHCLPGFLEAARSRGLRVEVSAVTGSESGYDVSAYIAQMAAICEPYENAVFEMANEPWHPSQKDLTPEFLESCQPSVPGVLISALGAAESDESSEYAAGPYITAHLDRSRPEWEMVRRVRELEALSDANGKPVLNNEPIKAGSQNANPSIFFTMAVLNRGFEVGGVFHSDDGLAGTVPTPGGQQQQLAEAYIRGSRVITTKQRMTYKNAGWHDSPIKEFSGAVRVYSFMADQSVCVALGIETETSEGPFSITTQNGWHLGPVLDEMPNVRVYQLVQ